MQHGVFDIIKPVTGREIVEKVKALDWPKGSYIVFGSGPMAAAGIREANDIDFLVSPELRKSLQKQGWKELVKNPNDKPLVRGDFEAHDNWNFSDYSPTLPELLSRAKYYDDVPFASLEDVRKWKASGKRPKDRADVKKIDQFLYSK